MELRRGISAKAARGRYFPLTYPEVKRILVSHPHADSVGDVTLEFRNTGEVPEYGPLLLEFEHGFALIVFSVAEQIPTESAVAGLQSALAGVLAFPALSTSPVSRGRRHLYRAYLGTLAAPIFTEVSRVYTVGRYRGNDRLATAAKPKLSSESERRLVV